MKYKRLLSACLAVALTVATVLPGAGAIQAEAAEAPAPIKTFSFEDDLGGSTAKTQANSGEYSGSITYEEGKVGKAVKLGSYGLQMNTGKVGTEYTVSMWVKPSQSLTEHSALIAMSAPKGATEYWTAVAGDTTSGTIKLWSHNGSDFRWTRTISGVALENNEWSLLTYTQSGNDAVIYINGEAKGSGRAAVSLGQDNNDLYIGVNNWDDLYNGLVDEVQVYDKALTADQVYALYDTTSPEDIFAEKGFTVDDKLTVYTGKTVKMTVDLPAGVAVSDAQISYESADTTVATVDNGVVTGVKAGTANITTKVKVGNTEKSLTTEVTVSDLAELDLPVVVKYEMNSGSGATVKDTSGNGFDATIVNPSGTSYVEDKGRSVLKINSADSYVTFPTSIYDELTDKEQFTIQAKYARTTLNNAWLFCIGSKAQSTGTNYLFYSPFFGGNTPRAGIKDSSESLYSFGSKSFSTDTYYTVTMVVNNGTISIYIDGMLMGSSLASGKNMASIVANGTQNDVLGFIGKSCWSADPNYTGSVDEFTIYDAALTEEQVQLSDPDVLKNKLQELSILGENESLDKVVYDLDLVKSVDGIEIEWSSDNEDIITTDGKVFNPDKDTEVTLTAKATSGLLEASVDFKAVVKALDLTTLKAVVKEAKEMDADIFEEESYKDLEKALENIDERVAAVKSQQEALEIEQEIRAAVSGLIYLEDYKDPWAKIEAAAPKEDATYKPGESEVLFTVPEGLENCVTVTYSSDNEEVATYVDGKVTAVKEGTAILTLTVTAKYDGYPMEYGTYVTVDKNGAPSAELPFVDVAKGDWYYDAVYYNYFEGIMTGLNDTHFGPADSLARAQFAVILYRMNDEPDVEYKATFPDVADGVWYTDAILWAADTKVVTGYTDSGKFGPADKINREQMAVMMYRYANYKDYESDAPEDISGYKDADKVSAFAKEAMEWAVGNGIISGKDGGTVLDPQGNASRAECATIIMRFIEKFEN